MEYLYFLFPYHVFAGSIAGSPRYMQTPRVCISVTTVRHPRIIGMVVHRHSVSELVVAAEEVSSPTERFPRCLTGHG